MSSIEGSCWPSALTFAALPIGFLPGFDANLNLSVKEFYNKDNNLGGTPNLPGIVEKIPADRGLLRLGYGLRGIRRGNGRFYEIDAGAEGLQFDVIIVRDRVVNRARYTHALPGQQADRR